MLVPHSSTLTTKEEIVVEKTFGLLYDSFKTWNK